MAISAIVTGETMSDPAQRSKTSPAAILTLIAQRAEALRKAGVTAVTIDNFSVQFAPYAEPSRESESADDEPRMTDPLHDPATYQGGVVPGFSLDGEGEKS